ncbi:hypothetical protein CF327_g3709 [Tilletia walkeri]|nr:hypothetical protein CF327_g3709 [Tilletia walkeri]
MSDELIDDLNARAEPVLQWAVVNPEERLGSASAHLELVQELIATLHEQVHNLFPEDYDTLMSALVGLRRLVSSVCASGEDTQAGTAAPILEKAPSGQWQYQVDPSLFQALCGQGFTDAEIGAILHWHPRTVIKRRLTMGISKRSGTDLSDSELVQVP